VDAGCGIRSIERERGVATKPHEISRKVDARILFDEILAGFFRAIS
jgi:hypothetical protein